MRKRIAVIDQWPDRPNAEKECVERIRRAGTSLGCEVVVIDKLGRVIGSGEEVTRDTVDFVLSLHYETPKCFDVHSYVALWNPIEFYFWWGYRRTAAHLATHDDFISCGSRWADDQAARLIHGDPSRRVPAFTLNHSLSEPVIAPRRRDDRRIFYCGINWERLGKGPGRHEEVLKALDARDMVRIYGPDLLDGVKVWGGFRNYVAPIPFDGVSCVHEIAKTGAALVFSSDAHRQSALMSNRLFEAAAAGVVILCDENPFAREHFGDSLIYIDTKRSQAEIGAEILERLAWLNANPDAAADLATRAQQIFKEKFCLKKQLGALLDGHETRAKSLASAYLARDRRYAVRMICFFDGQDRLDDVHKLARDVNRQIYPLSRVDVVLGPDAPVEADVRAAMRPVQCEVHIHQAKGSGADGRTGARGDILAELAEGRPYDELICMVTSGATLFADHVSSLVRKFEDSPTLQVAFSDVLLNHQDPAGNEFRDFQQVRSPKDSRKVVPHHVSENFLARFAGLGGSLSACLSYLDEAIPYALACGAGNEIAFTRRATVMKRLGRHKSSCLTLDRQFLLVGDCFPEHETEESNPDLVDMILQMDSARKRRILVGLAKSSMSPRVERLTRWFYKIVRRAA